MYFLNIILVFCLFICYNKNVNRSDHNISKLKFASAVLASSLIITPISALVSNYDNLAKAEEQQIKISNKDIEEALIIKDYIKLQKKRGIYRFQFTNDPSLNQRLKEINSPLNDIIISQYISNLNDHFIKENGNGPLTSAIKEIRKNSKSDNIISMNTYFRASDCSLAFFGLSTYVGGLYTVVGIIAASTPVGLIGFGLTTAISAIGTAYCG
ncbi:hypothetical protein [Gemella sp. zg-1178]|uniref:hypothetical protein n=1 Tax=Gemella sp. zg-1178 TaxID=2840372 RepID=UPI001C04BC00|nr:hypothetical protein [Gemella sp. zg-1178]MBU0279385.1 hypothetical protein [Gemella sp. zg-1178]